MIEIKDNQMKLIERSYLDRFITTMLDFVRSNVKNLKEDDIQLRKEVERVIVEAIEFQILDEEDIETYLYLKWKYTELNEQPMPQAALDILTYPDRSAAAKIDLLIALYGPNYTS